MRGSPLVRVALIVGALLLLLVPLRHLTAKREAARVPVARPAAAAERVRLALTTTAGPAEFRVTHLGREIWSGRVEAGGTARGEAELAFPAAGIDLAVTVQWPGDTLGAARLSVARGAEADEAHTGWGTGSVDEVFTYRGAP